MAKLYPGLSFSPSMDKLISAFENILQAKCKVTLSKKWTNEVHPSLQELTCTNLHLLRTLKEIPTQTSKQRLRIRRQRKMVTFADEGSSKFSDKHKKRMIEKYFYQGRKLLEFQMQECQKATKQTPKLGRQKPKNHRDRSSSDSSVKELPEWLIEATDVILPANSHEKAKKSYTSLKININRNDSYKKVADRLKVPSDRSKEVVALKRPSAGHEALVAETQPITKNRKISYSKALVFTKRRSTVSVQESSLIKFQLDSVAHLKQSETPKTRSHFIVKSQRSFIKELASLNLHKTFDTKNSQNDERLVAYSLSKKAKDIFQAKKPENVGLEDTLKKPIIDLNFGRDPTLLSSKFKSTKSQTSSDWAKYRTRFLNETTAKANLSNESSRLRINKRFQAGEKLIAS